MSPRGDFRTLRSGAPAPDPEAHGSDQSPQLPADPKATLALGRIVSERPSDGALARMSFTTLDVVSGAAANRGSFTTLDVVSGAAANRGSFTTLDSVGNTPSKRGNLVTVDPVLGMAATAPLGGAHDPRRLLLHLPAAELGVTHEHAGRYGVEGDSELGRGGIGRVFVALDKHLGRRVAVKELLLDGSDDPNRPGMLQTVARFLREARITGQLDHPNIVPVYELGRRADGSLYYTMRVVRGRTLSRALSDAKTLAKRLELLGHFIGLCQAIAYAHSRGVVHRDIKPDNVMIGEFGETVVLDWGMAKASGDEAERASVLPVQDPLRLDVTVDGSLCGTPTHMSPEQARGAIQEVDARSDVWALGVVLYSLLAGKNPFEGKTLGDLIHAILRAKYAPLASIDPAIPAELAAIAERALKPIPNERYESARELLRDVEAYRSGARVGAYAYSPLDLLRRFLERHRTAAVASGVGLAVALVLAVASYVRLAAARDRALVAEQRATRNERQARASERAAKQSLSYVLVEKAQQAMSEGDRTSAEILAASALELAELADARGIVLASESTFRPEPKLVHRAAAGCKESALSYFAGVLACARGEEVTLYDLRDGESRGVLRAHGSVAAIDLSRDGSHLVVAHEGGVVSLFALDTGVPRLLYERSVGSTTRVALSSDGKYVACGGDGAVLAFESAAPAREYRLAVKQKVSALRFHPSAERLVVAGELGMVSLFTLGAKGQLELRGHNGTVRALAFAQEGRLLASAGEDHTVRFWDATTGEPGPPPIVHTDAITSLSWTEDGKLLAYGSKDKSLHLADLKTPEQKPTLLNFHDDSVDAVALAPDFSELVSVSRDLGPVTWSLEGIRKGSVLVERGNVLSLGFVPGKDELVSAGLGVNGVAIWNMASGEADTRLPAGVDRIRSLIASPDGSKLAFAGSGGRVLLWDLPSRIPLRVFENGRDEVRAVSFSSDNRWLAFGGLDRTLHIVDSRSFEDVARFENPSALQGVAFVPGTAIIATVDREGMLGGYDVSRQRQAFRIKAHDEWALSVAASADGKRLVSGGGDRHVKIWDAGGGRLLADCPGHEGKVLSVDVSPDGRIVASGSEDKSVRIWDATTGLELARLVGHAGAVRAVRFAPAGDVVLSGSDDGTIRVWRLAALFTKATKLEQSVATRFHVELVGTRVVRAKQL